MKLKAKKFGVTTGYPNVIIINQIDAHNHDFHPGDRVLLKKGKLETMVIIDILGAHSKKIINLNPGEIGLFEEVSETLRIKNDDLLTITPADKPESIKYIRKKIDGIELTESELIKIVTDIVEGKLTEIEMTYFVSAVSIHNLTFEEITYLTKAIANSGDRFKTKKYPVIDKHCIGGVPGNRTTMVVIPIMAALGLIVPKSSSRAITSPAGTADTMECLTNVSLTLDEMKTVVKKTNACMVWGGGMNLAPADDKIIRIERPMSIDVTGLMLSSVMAKKYSVGATHVLIDIPFGKNSKVDKKSDAERLKEHFLTIGKLLGMEIIVTLTDGRQPIGNGIGPLLEAIDVMKVLENKPDAPQDLKEKSITLAGTFIEFLGKAKKGHGKNLAKEILESGAAYKKMNQIIDAQGRKKLEKPSPFKKIILSTKSGKVKEIHNKIITRITRITGAPTSDRSGIYLHKKVSDNVKKGEALFTVYAESKKKLSYVEKYLKKEFPYIIK